MYRMFQSREKHGAESVCSLPSDVLCVLIFFHLSPALHAMSLPTLTCSYCMRKVGLWNFFQMEGMTGESDTSTNAMAQSTQQAAGPATAATQDGQAEQTVSASPSPATTPCRMKLRSQDSTRSDQARFTSRARKIHLHIFILIRRACPMYTEVKENLHNQAAELYFSTIS